MAWTIKFHRAVEKDLRKLDQTVQRRILKYLREKISTLDHPYAIGKALKYGQRGLWRYSVGDYRIICQIKEKEWVVLVVHIAHRKEVYVIK